MKFVGPFQMKQFSVAHDNCAMRVNTDGCLLGAIAGENHHQDSVQTRNWISVREVVSLHFKWRNVSTMHL